MTLFKITIYAHNNIFNIIQTNTSTKNNTFKIAIYAHDNIFNIIQTITSTKNNNFFHCSHFQTYMTASWHHAMLPVPDSVTKSTYLSTKTCSLASAVPFQNNLSTLSSSSTTAVQLAGYSLFWVGPQDHHLNLCSKQARLSKGDSPQKYIEGDTSFLTTPSDSVLHDQEFYL